MLENNSVAPSFSLADQEGVVRTLAEFKGHFVLLYFYPKDDTPGCTKEACAIAEIYHEFETLGVVVLGVSKDSPASHKKFAQKYSLPFTLLSDESTEMIQSYDAWKEKSMYGKKYLGIDRISYLIRPDGTIAKSYPKVDPANHALEILTDIKALVA